MKPSWSHGVIATIFKFLINMQTLVNWTTLRLSKTESVKEVMFTVRGQQCLNSIIDHYECNEGCDPMTV